MRVLVVTIVHHPSDARIWHRQIRALLAAGHAVTYAAPFVATGTPFPIGVQAQDLPRAQGLKRWRAIRSATRFLRIAADQHDVVLLHDPELLLAARGVRRVPVIWDVHEDTAAALPMKSWLPSILRSPAIATIHFAERWAERHCHLLLAETGYADRFTRPHPIVPNSTNSPISVQRPGQNRCVYLGSLTRARGVFEMIELARLLGPNGPRLHLIGSADTESSSALEAASDVLVWHGFVPNDQALLLLDGALVGISLLHDEANYRHSQPTKIIEYMAHGIPVITTPTPPAQALVVEAECGFVVQFGDVVAAATAIRGLIEDPNLRDRFGANGRAAALAKFDWRSDSIRFVAEVELIASEGIR